jgi:hypothetical protein
MSPDSERIQIVAYKGQEGLAIAIVLFESYAVYLTDKSRSLSCCSIN